MLTVLVGNEVNGVHIGLKLKLLKAKLIAAKAPHIAAKVAVAKEVKAHKALAFAKTVAAVRKILILIFLIWKIKNNRSSYLDQSLKSSCIQRAYRPHSRCKENVRT